MRDARLIAWNLKTNLASSRIVVVPTCRNVGDPDPCPGRDDSALDICFNGELKRRVVWLQNTIDSFTGDALP
jgi:hypothetical protein